MVLFVVALVVGVSISRAAASPALLATERVSVPDPATGEMEATRGGDFPAISEDGRIVAFRSFSSNLVPGDTNGVRDVFVRDRAAGTTQRVSVSSIGVQGNGESGMCEGHRGLETSGDGRYILFISAAVNLVPGDTNGECDLFLRDRQAGTTERVNLPDPATGQTQADGPSAMPSMSEDGRFVAFFSRASNLVPGVSEPGIFVRDRVSGSTVWIPPPAGRTIASPALSGDGQVVAFVGPVGGVPNVGLYDRSSGTYELVSAGLGGGGGNAPSSDPLVSGTGRYVAFQSSATNLVAGDTNGVMDVFVLDRQAGVTLRVSVSSTGQQGNDVSRYPSISGDGAVVTFESFASDLVPGDTNDRNDIFVRDLVAGTTERVSLPDPSTGESQSDGNSSAPAADGDGGVVAFDSVAGNLIDGDHNAAWDAFVRVRASGRPGGVTGPA